MERIPDRRTIARDVLDRKIKMKMGGKEQTVTLEHAVLMKLKQIAIEDGEPWVVKLIEKVMEAAHSSRMDHAMTTAHPNGGAA